jgi:hypothetical protein
MAASYRFLLLRIRVLLAARPAPGFGQKRAQILVIGGGGRRCGYAGKL